MVFEGQFWFINIKFSTCRKHIKHRLKFTKMASSCLKVNTNILNNLNVTSIQCSYTCSIPSNALIVIKSETTLSQQINK